jgi:hypothetical protein
MLHRLLWENMKILFNTAGVAIGTLVALIFVAGCGTVETIVFGEPTMPQQALKYAKSVVLVKRVVKDNQVYSYVKEVWRLDPNTGTPPQVGSEYGHPMPNYSAHVSRVAERDAIVFKFGADCPKELPAGWTIQVVENGMVTPFEMDVDDVRTAVKETKP